MLDANFVPQLGHSGLRLHPVEKKSEYTVIKTKVLQASLAYFPEDFVRHGQLTEKVDIFAYGIVSCGSSWIILHNSHAKNWTCFPLIKLAILLPVLRLVKCQNVIS